MPESEIHKNLVKSIADDLLKIDSDIKVYADLDPCYGFDKPHKINGHIPDVYALHKKSHKQYIGEAKTRGDLQSSRSVEQISQLISYIDRPLGNTFILATNGSTAPNAKAKLRFMIVEKKFNDCSIQVYDGLDYWKFDRGKQTWLLL